MSAKRIYMDQDMLESYASYNDAANCFLDSIALENIHLDTTLQMEFDIVDDDLFSNYACETIGETVKNMASKAKSNFVTYAKKLVNFLFGWLIRFFTGSANVKQAMSKSYAKVRDYLKKLNELERKARSADKEEQIEITDYGNCIVVGLFMMQAIMITSKQLGQDLNQAYNNTRSEKDNGDNKNSSTTRAFKMIDVMLDKLAILFATVGSIEINKTGALVSKLKANKFNVEEVMKGYDPAAKELKNKTMKDAGAVESFGFNFGLNFQGIGMEAKKKATTVVVNQDTFEKLKSADQNLQEMKNQNLELQKQIEALKKAQGSGQGGEDPGNKIETPTDAGVNAASIAAQGAGGKGSGKNDELVVKNITLDGDDKNKTPEVKDGGKSEDTTPINNSSNHQGPPNGKDSGSINKDEITKSKFDRLNNDKKDKKDNPPEPEKELTPNEKAEKKLDAKSSATTKLEEAYKERLQDTAKYMSDPDKADMSLSEAFDELRNGLSMFMSISKGNKWDLEKHIKAAEKIRRGIEKELNTISVTNVNDKVVSDLLSRILKVGNHLGQVERSASVVVKRITACIDGMTTDVVKLGSKLVKLGETD